METSGKIIFPAFEIPVKSSFCARVRRLKFWLLCALLIRVYRNDEESRLVAIRTIDGGISGFKVIRNLDDYFFTMHSVVEY
ncbi:11689_t:CDS:2, partial [Acaulospora morrowiae]